MNNSREEMLNTCARSIARCVRGCATDEQYSELIDGIKAVLGDAHDASLHLRSEIGALREALREVAIWDLKHGPHDSKCHTCCSSCEQSWPCGAPESHAPGCLAALPIEEEPPPQTVAGKVEVGDE